MIRRLVWVFAVMGLLLGAGGVAQAAPPTPASGTYTATTIISFEVNQVGPNTVIEQTAAGIVSGTLSGTLVEEIKAIVHPNGVVPGQGTFTCACTMGGESGTLEFVVATIGDFATQTFQGRAIITSATGDLTGLRGVLELQGTVDPSGLSTITYEGGIHDHS